MREQGYELQEREQDERLLLPPAEFVSNLAFIARTVGGAYVAFSQLTHPGNMPIRVLQNNIILHFENATPGILEKHIEWVMKASDE